MGYLNTLKLKTIGNYEKEDLNSIRVYDYFKRKFKVFPHEIKAFNEDPMLYIDNLIMEVNHYDINEKLKNFSIENKMNKFEILLSREELGLMVFLLEPDKVSLGLFDKIEVFLGQVFGFKFKNKNEDNIDNIDTEEGQK